MPGQLPPLLDRPLGLARVDFAPAHRRRPIVTRISSEPRWLFFRMAIAVTLVLWLPDLYILYRGEPGRAVAVLALMHLAIALVTYNCLVHIAKVRPAARRPAHAYGSARPSAADPYDPYRDVRRGS